MSDLRHPFERFERDDVRALIHEYPLAWVCSDAQPGTASLLPLLGRYDEGGALIAVIGHLGRANPLRASLVADPRATLLFTGPQAYVSPEHAGVRDWGPTWNYAQLAVRAEIHFEAESTGAALDLLIDAMERERASPWSASELGARYDSLVRHIIGFEGRVTALTGKFKLGQDECPAVLRSILSRHPDAAMRRWMERMNAGR